MRLVTPQSIDSYAKREAGGKGYNLYLLTREGLNIPPWVVLGASVFEEFKGLTGLDDSIEKQLINVVNQSVSAKQASRNITRLILDTPLPLRVQQIASKAFGMLNASSIAVRSSATDEDSAKCSFAGQLSTKLFIKNKTDSLKALKECWGSAFSERNIAYRIQNGLSLAVTDIKVAVIFQVMIEAEKSGVLFTCDPVNQDSSKITINSVYGIGEGLVSGSLDADMFVIDKVAGRKISETIARKTKMIIKSSSGGQCKAAVEPALRKVPSLTTQEIASLVRMARKVENYYRFPQDIEWAQNKEQLYILQSRPVTSPIINHEGKLNIWDNSNISESYSGITLPLTFGFAHYVYHQVYIQFCEILLVPHREIKNMDFFLKNMLGLFYGRVYYNLLNWYKLTSILPGYKYNRAFMETMMGTKKALESDIADRIKPLGFQENFSSKFRRALTGLKFLYYHFTIQLQVDRFMDYFYNVYNKYRKFDYARMPADEIAQKYYELEMNLLRGWKAPIINDFLCMVHFGLLKRLSGRWLGHLRSSLQNDLLCGEGSLESTEPTRKLIQMSTYVRSNPALKRLIENTPNEDCLEVLNQSDFSRFNKRVESYIEKYGFRCMNEMKLEEKDLYQDPSFLFACLKNYLHSDIDSLNKMEQREAAIRQTAEMEVGKNLSGIKRIIYFWSLRNARKAIRNRENTRFCRTRIYGVVRAMFYGIGDDYVRRQIINVPKDIFYLELNELLGSVEGTLTVQNLQVLVEARKQEYARYNSVEPADRFITRGPAYWMNRHFVQEDTAEESELKEGLLLGVGCSPGVVEGDVKVVLSRKDNMQLDGEILVTKQTDPGWIPLYPSASGLLVERGGLLSHSAIVAREMGLPTIVSVPGLTRILRTGMRVRLDGKAGTIEILD